MSDESLPVTRLIRQANEGNREAADRLLNAVYGELYHLASRYMLKERPGHTLQPTALVNEAYVRMFSTDPVDVNDRSHFFVIAARQMRRILVDHARSVNAQKRGSGGAKVDLEDAGLKGEPLNEDVLAVDEALAHLEKVDPRASQVVELKFFAGLPDQEAADTLGISFATLRRDWEFARAFLYNCLHRPERSEG